MPWLKLYLLSSQEIQHYFTSYGYVGIYFFFITIDQIAPIPEEITLIVIGYLAAQHFFNPFLAGFFAVAAFITIDVVYFQLTKHGNKFIKKMTTKADTPKMRGYKKQLRANMFKTLLGISFIPRVRLLAPVFVALAELPFKRFMVYSAICLSTFTALYISIGVVFHRSINTLIEKMPGVNNIIFIVGMVVVMVFLTYVAFRKFRKPRKHAK